jgi:hypothetical protein
MERVQTYTYREVHTFTKDIIEDRHKKRALSFAGEPLNNAL